MDKSTLDTPDAFCLLAIEIIAFVRAARLWKSLTTEEEERLQTWKDALSRQRLTGPWATLWRQAVVLVGMMAAMRYVSVAVLRWALVLEIEIADLLSEMS